MKHEPSPWVWPVARIVARYAAGAMVAYGLTDHDTAQSWVNDPDMLILIGTAIAGVVEGAYAIATRRGWAT